MTWTNTVHEWLDQRGVGWRLLTVWLLSGVVGRWAIPESAGVSRAGIAVLAWNLSGAISGYALAHGHRNWRASIIRRQRRLVEPTSSDLLP